MDDKIKCLVFDCDGVILDSVPVKTRAFARLAEPYGQEAVDRMVMYHTAHGGVSRYLKFEWFFQEILHRDITEQEKEEWAKLFAQYAVDEVRRCNLIPGAEAVLENWFGRLPMYICSGAPKSELEMLLGERGMAHYFNAIYGSPPSKADLLMEIVRREKNLAPAEFLMIGDARTDVEAASAAETQFYGVGPELKGGNFPWSANLVSLNEWLNEHAAD